MAVMIAIVAETAPMTMPAISPGVRGAGPPLPLDEVELEVKEMEVEVKVELEVWMAVFELDEDVVNDEGLADGVELDVG